MRSSVALKRADEPLAVLTAVLVKIPFLRNVTLWVWGANGQKDQVTPSSN
jgi:hypothetical protein